MNQETINKINEMIEEELSIDIDVLPTGEELDAAFDSIQSEAIKEDSRALERARVKAIPAFRMLVIE